MKINHPVTNNEQMVRPDQIILSTTDLKGAISYINRDFVEISGFSSEELMEKNHNMVRHPDMPPAAFESLWSTVKVGKPWMGIVKNRCKNGDHYWVDAFVMPIQTDGATVEYQSVRYQPDRAAVDRAESIYKRLLAGRKIGTRLFAGLGLTAKLIIGNSLALLPALVFSYFPPLVSFAYAGFIITAFLIAAVNAWLMTPMRGIIGLAKDIYDQPAMRRIYTGRDDEFGQIMLALKMQNSQINAIVGRLADTSGKLYSAASLTSTTSEQAHRGVEVQQNELTQVATAMTEMVATVQEIARSAALAAESAAAGQHETSIGGKVVEQTISAINALANEVQKAAGVIEKLSEQSTSIVKVLDVIKGIAEQTNLLALNAAIEAARAGENGRGFAVVADEVRTLASRTTESAREIEEMIEMLQSGSQQAVNVMDHSRNQAESSVELAAKAGVALNTISSAIDNINDMNHQIATASEEQRAVAEDINQSIVNINSVAESTSRGAQESAMAVDDMVGAIRRLGNLINQFKR